MDVYLMNTNTHVNKKNTAEAKSYDLSHTGKKQKTKEHANDF